jgi:surfactin synthase thioesterase subunit
MILFCLPYAGGSESIYFNWKNYLDPSIRLYSIVLKGRGARYNDTFYDSLEDAVEDIFNNIKNMIVEEDYAIYGHSMGSLLAYELYYKINEMGARKPKHIFFSGNKPPNIPRDKDNIHTLPKHEFWNEIIALGGTTEEVLDSNELLEIVLPILKNDFKIIETYRYKEKATKIECNISVLNGKQDSIILKDLLSWNDHTNRRCRIYDFNGGHFFINDNAKKVTSIINSTLIK